MVQMRAVLTFYSMLLAAQDLGVQSKQANEAMAQGRYREAAAAYEKLTAALPDNAGLRLNLGLALFEMGEYGRAAVQLNQATARKPDLQPAWLLLGLSYQKQDTPKLAIAPLIRALELKPGDGTALLELGDAYLRTGDAWLAMAEFQKLAALEAGNPKAWAGLGLSYLELSQAAGKRLERSAPGSAWDSALRAGALVKQKRWAEAFELYRRAEAVPGAHRSIAAIYRETGHQDWAAIEEARESAAALLPWEELLVKKRSQSDPESLYWTARAGQALFEVAAERLATLPESSERHELLAQSYEGQGRRAEAAAEWRAAVKLAAGDARLQGPMARALWRNREYDQARPLLEALAKRQPGTAEWQYLLGDLCYRVGQSDRAVPYLEAALKREPGQVAAHAVLGRVYMQLGQPPKAIPHLQAALAEDEDGSLHYELSLAYRRTGQPELAKAVHVPPKTGSEVAAPQITPPPQL